MKKSKFTEEQIVRILEEAKRGEKTHVQICKDHGVNLNTFYIWRRKYAGMQTQDRRQLRELERENAQLKKLLAERDLEIDAGSVPFAVRHFKPIHQARVPLAERLRGKLHVASSRRMPGQSRLFAI